MVEAQQQGLPKAISDTIKFETANRAMLLRDEGGRYTNSLSDLFDNLRVFDDTEWMENKDVALTEDQRERVNKVKHSQDKDAILIRGYASKLAERLMDPEWRRQRGPSLDYSDFSTDHGVVKKFISSYGVQGEAINQEGVLTELLVLGTEIQLEEVEAELDRAAVMQDSQTTKVRERLFQRQQADALQQLGLDKVDLAHPETLLSPTQIRARIVDAAIAAHTDPRGFTRGIEFIMTRAPRLRIFVPDAIRLLAPATEALDKTWGVLKVATSADKPADRAIEGGLTGEGIRSIVAMEWKPILKYAESYDPNTNLPKDISENEAVLGTAEALDFLAGNKPEFDKVGDGKYKLRLREVVGTHSIGDEITLWDLSDSERDAVLSGTIKVDPVYRKNEAGVELDPRRPEQIIPGERVLTLPSMIREMQGADPLRDYYLRSAGVNEKKLIGYRTISGLATEQSAVLSWNDPLLAAANNELKSKLVAVDLLTIRAGAFMTRAMQLFGVTQYDAFFDPACRAKQHLESSMRSVVPNEYWERHAIMDGTLREAALSVFGALTGRKIQMNALQMALAEGAKKAIKGEWGDGYSDKLINDVVDPYQLTQGDKALGLVKFSSSGGETRIKEQQRILEAYTVTTREFVGYNKDMFDVNRLVAEARNIQDRFPGEPNRVERERLLGELRKRSLGFMRYDYLAQEKNGGYYVNQRSAFKHPRPTVEQAAMLHAMSAKEKTAIRDMSFKNTIVSMGGPANLEDWAYEGWYGYMMTMEHAQSWKMFFWGDDAKIEQMQLKYMGKAGEAFGIAAHLVEGMVQALDPITMEQAGLDIGKGNLFSPDSLAEGAGQKIAQHILNSKVSGGEQVRGYFKKLGESIVGYAKSLPWLPGEEVKRQMRMYVLFLGQVVESAVKYQWNYGKGLGSQGSEKQLLTVDPRDSKYGEVNAWLIKTIRETGNEVVFPETGLDKPYVAVKGHRVAYMENGEFDAKNEWHAAVPGGNELKARYDQKNLELFSTHLTTRVMEEYLRDSGTFDVDDQAYILKQMIEIGKDRQKELNELGKLL